MSTVADRNGFSESAPVDDKSAVLTQALRSMRNSALRCRRARLMIENQRAACATTASFSEERETFTAGAQ